MRPWVTLSNGKLLQWWIPPLLYQYSAFMNFPCLFCPSDNLEHRLDKWTSFGAEMKQHRFSNYRYRL